MRINAQIPLNQHTESHINNPKTTH